MFTTILLGLLLSALDQTIAPSALPAVVGDLGGSGHPSWIVTASMPAGTIAAVLAGKSDDLFGRMRIFRACVDVLIAARAVQGGGAGRWSATPRSSARCSAVCSPGNRRAEKQSWQPTG
ncbi:hypothetical protein ACFV2H_30255 [Streptomyces sp. NPDC059629]|uniref:hypothetical protein n=1 Tax=Streptomyces sp. NPDC059629 TaxID=3346889 RepID=UPI0036D1D8FE